MAGRKKSGAGDAEGRRAERAGVPELPLFIPLKKGSRERDYNTKLISPLSADLLILWTVQDSNLPPPHCKCGALPDELTALLLFAHNVNYYTQRRIFFHPPYGVTMEDCFFFIASVMTWSRKSEKSTCPALSAFGSSDSSVSPGSVFISSR